MYQSQNKPAPSSLLIFRSNKNAIEKQKNGVVTMYSEISVGLREGG